MLIKLTKLQSKALRYMSMNPKEFLITQFGGDVYIGEGKTTVQLVHKLLSLGAIEDVSNDWEKVERYQITVTGVKASKEGCIEVEKIKDVWEVRKSLINARWLIDEKWKNNVAKKIKLSSIKDRVMANDWYRASGKATCSTCQKDFKDHAEVPKFTWLTQLCNGDLVKL